MLLHVSWHLAIWVLPIGVTQEHHMKPPGLDLYLGGISPCLVTCPCWVSPAHGDLDSTQILTQQCSAMSQTVSQLTNMGNMPTRQVPIVHPLRVIKTPAYRVRVYAAHPSDKSDISGGFIHYQCKSK
jgi:hypothetical protein